MKTGCVLGLPRFPTSASSCLTSRRPRRVVVGKLLRGMSMTVEIPPIAAAVVPVTMPENICMAQETGRLIGT